MASAHETERQAPSSPKLSIAFRSGDSLRIVSSPDSVRYTYHFHEGGTKIIEREVKNPSLIAEVASSYNDLKSKVGRDRHLSSYQQEIKSVLDTWKAVTLMTIIPSPSYELEKESKKFAHFVEGNMFEAMGYLKHKVQTENAHEIVHILLNKPNEQLVHIGISLASPPGFNRTFQEDFKKIATDQAFSDELRERAYTFLFAVNRKNVKKPRSRFLFSIGKKTWENVAIHFPTAEATLILK